MLQSLPRSIRMKLDQTLAQWPQWNCSPAITHAPTVVEVLTAGISNHSILVEAEQRFVVRIDGLAPATHGLCRQSEWRTLQAAFAMGLTPRPCYFNPDLGSLVCNYLAPDAAQERDIADVAHLLHNIHRLPHRHHRLNLSERIVRYEKQLEHMGRTPDDTLQACGARVAGLLEEIDRQPGESVLCHNDLLRANRIYSAGKLWAIDWEYCAMASPWYDIAVIVNGDALNGQEALKLLTTYLGRAPNDQERATLYRYSCVYRYLELLWYLAQETPVLDALALQQKLTELHTLLAYAGD